MFADEIFHFLSDGGTHTIEFIASGWDASKAATVAFAAFSALGGIYVKWRNSGYRMVDRLEEFLRGEQGKVKECRKALASALEIPIPGNPGHANVFKSASLKKATRSMDWGFGPVSLNDLPNAVRTMSDQARLAREQGELHKGKEILAHLLLGAKAAARPFKNDEERRKFRAEALEEFDKVIALDRNDADALEYSGLMLLDLANVPTAIARFEKLLRLRRKNEDGILIARAHQLLAKAYERLPRPDWSSANRELSAALDELPEASSLLRAQVNEQQAIVRMNRKHFAAAKDNLIEASAVYARMSQSKAKKVVEVWKGSMLWRRRSIA